MNREEFQFVVDTIVKEHDTIYEFLQDATFANDREGLRKDELPLRKFLLKAREMGFKVDGLHYLNDKIHNLNVDASKEVKND